MSRLARLGAFLRDRYCTVDPRSLGLFRIALGVLLFADVARRAPDLVAHYTNQGWLPNHAMLFKPMSSHLFSVYLAFGPPAEVWLLFGLHLLVNLLLVVGWRTKLMQVLAAVLIISLNSRNILLENGGWVVLHLLCVWTLFLPLGRRYSVDAWLASLRAEREGTLGALNRERGDDVRPVVSLAVTALILQYAVIYYFNTVHKSGTPWREGTAVYYFFQQDRMVTWLGVWLREHLPLGAIKLLTWSTLVIEGSLVALWLSPVFQRQARRIALLLAAALHLSIDAVVQLGPFSWAMVIVYLVLLPSPEDWRRIGERLRRTRSPVTVVVHETSGASLQIARWIRRLDTLGLVRFQAAEEAVNEGVAADLVESRFVARDEAGVARSGAAAAGLVAGVLPWPPAAVRLLSALGLVAFAGRRLDRWVNDRERVTARHELEPLVGVDERDEPTEAAAFAGKLRAGFATLCVAVLLVAETSQVLEENRAVPAWLKPKQRPAWMTAIVVYPRLFQGWSMFAPQPPTEDGRIVVDGRRADGSKFDPLSGREPTLEVQPRDGFRMNQIWGDFHRRIAEQRYTHHINGVRDMLIRYHEITGRPQDRLVAFEVCWVTETIQPWGAPKPKPNPPRKVLSWGRVEAPICR